MGEDHTPRPDDHLVEPMYEALRERGPGPAVDGGPDEDAGPAARPETAPEAASEPGPQPEAGRGCLGLLLLGAVSLGLMAALSVA